MRKNFVFTFLLFPFILLIITSIVMVFASPQMKYYGTIQGLSGILLIYLVGISYWYKRKGIDI